MMLRRGRVWLTVGLLAVSACNTAWAQGAPPADVNAAAKAVIADCASRLGSGATGLAQVEGHCPELASALQTAGVRPLIIASSRDRFDRQSLPWLATLLHPALATGPDVSRLDPILRGLRRPVAQSSSWWQRVWHWIVRHLNGNAPNAADSWWAKFVRQVIGAPLLWAGLILCALVALVVAVVVVVAREIRAGRTSKAPPVAIPIAPIGPASSQLALLRQVPLAQRPARLFALLISRLVSADRLPADRSLTHREVVRRVQLEESDQRRYVESLARLSEQQLYSGATTSPEGIEEFLARGEDLYTTGWSRPAGD
ncbi:MAG TPA: DUF4129 domain-containing protein [Steroidobacteraceae bacterium]|jgi:hypothetical protein